MLSSFQKKVSAAAITCLAICVLVAFIGLIFFLLGAFLGRFGGVVLPVAIAMILSFMLSPLVDFFSRKLHVRRTWACILTFVLASLAIALGFVFAIPAIIDQLAQLFAAIPDAMQKLTQHLIEKFPDGKDFIVEKFSALKNFVISGISMNATVSTLQKLATTASAATGGIIAVCTYVTALAVTPIYLYYMLTANVDFFGRLERNLNFLDKKPLSDIVFLAHRFAEIMTTFFRGQMMIAIIMGILFGTGLMLSGVKFGFMLGFTAGVLNIIPYFGTIIGLSTILPVAALQDGGGLWLAALSLAIFIMVQLIEAYILTPKIMGDRTGLHPTVIIFSVFFWGIALNGILGMILAIPLSAFIAALWQRILQRLRESNTES